MAQTRRFFRLSKRKAVAAVQIALCLTVLLGVTALVVDGGLLMAERRRAQSVADSAALAAATDLFKHYPTYNGVDSLGSASSSAKLVASTNGYANDGTNSVVSVNIPPSTAKSAYFNSKSGFAEVNITFKMPRGFSGIWGSSRLNVSAHAVARGMWAPDGNGIILLNPTASGSLTMKGNGSLVVNGGGVIVDSNSSSAAITTGNGMVTASPIQIVGDYSGNGYSTTPVTGATPDQDPLRNLPEPARPSISAPTPTYNSATSTWTLSPGSYDGPGDPASPNAKNGDTIVFNQASTNGNGGIYYFYNGLSVQNVGLSMGSGTGGIMLFMAGGTINGCGNGKYPVSLSGLDGSVASTSIYKGMIYFQSRSNTTAIGLAGNGNCTLHGTFYAPTAAVSFTGNGSGTIGSQLIADTMSMKGNGNMTVDYAAGPVAPTRMLSLVE